MYIVIHSADQLGHLLASIGHALSMPQSIYVDVIEYIVDIHT